MWDFNLIIHVLCMYHLVHKSTGEIDEQCKVDCACCKDGICGPGQWFSDECTLGCIDGYTRARCYTKCPGNCRKCNQNPGTCLICHDGYYNLANDCTSVCLSSCKTCTSGTICTSCKEGYYNDNGHNDCRYRYCPEHCYCDNPGQCASCKDSFYDTSNSCNSLCPGNCVDCLSKTECGSCKDGYYKGYQNDNSNLPLSSDCTNQCRDNCVRCSSYNSCLSCSVGFYGIICDNKCSNGCIANTCDTISGNCDCSQNFVGERCDKCKPGKYGNMCNKQCPGGCKDSMCEKESGDCTNGCTIKTITGNKCDVCSNGWYGQNCNISCAVGCKNQQCERSNGECSSGCLVNFEGNNCERCIYGNYEELCSSRHGNVSNEKGNIKEQEDKTVVIVLGTLLTVSVVCNIGVVTFVLLKLRQRAKNSDNDVTSGQLYENSASVRKSMVTSLNYEDLGTAQVPENDYGQIHQDGPKTQ